jgi:hypothetical protein
VEKIAGHHPEASSTTRTSRLHLRLAQCQRGLHQAEAKAKGYDVLVEQSSVQASGKKPAPAA